MMRLDWTELSKEDKLAVIRVGVMKKMSALQISEEMDNCTRNAIIGMANRNGIKLQGSSSNRTNKRKPTPPKTGLKTRPLKPLRVIKARKHVATPKAAPEPANQPVERKRDWRKMSAAEKADYVRVMMDDGCTAREINETLIGASRSAISACASRNGIVSKYNPHRSKYFGNPAPLDENGQVKITTSDWRKMRPEEKIETIKRGVKQNKTSQEIADSVIGTTAKNIRNYASANKISIANDTTPAKRDLTKLTWQEMTPDEKVDFIKPKLSDGLTYTEIAQLTVGATRRSVSGVVTRNNLTRPKSMVRVSRVSVNSNLSAAKTVNLADLPQIKNANSIGINILDINNHQCRAPLWEDKPLHAKRDISEYIFCGNPTKEGSSFCAGHHSQIWTSVKEWTKMKEAEKNKKRRDGRRELTSEAI